MRMQRTAQLTLVPHSRHTKITFILLSRLVYVLCFVLTFDSVGSLVASTDLAAPADFPWCLRKI